MSPDTPGMDFEKRLEQAITGHSLLREGAPVIVAVSGGADSVALLCALSAIGYQCVAAHCNYHLRGEESNRDMRHVQALCASLGVDLYVRDFDVAERRRLTGESLEMACRELRYQWFASLLDRLRAQAIAVAHHREDNIETFFLNLMRGSGIAGLTGMRRRSGHVVRPLLDFSRADIEAYLAARGIEYVDDSTNAESVFARNRLRNIVLPALAEQFPGAEEGILASLAYLGENRDFYDSAMRAKAELYFTGKVIHLAELVRDEAHARLVLFEMLRPLGFNITHVDNILASATKSGLVFQTGNTRLELDRGRLLVEARTGTYSADEAEVSLARDILSPLHISIADLPVTAFKPVRDASVACFDISLLQGNPRFALRHWRRGDRITPFGMRGSRLLSDIFSDAKLSAAAKRSLWVLTRDDIIIWIPGIRTTDRYPVTPETRRYLQFTLHGRNGA